MNAVFIKENTDQSPQVDQGAGVVGCVRGSVGGVPSAFGLSLDSRAWTRLHLADSLAPYSLLGFVCVHVGLCRCTQMNALLNSCIKFCCRQKSKKNSINQDG